MISKKPKSIIEIILNIREIIVHLIKQVFSMLPYIKSQTRTTHEVERKNVIVVSKEQKYLPKVSFYLNYETNLLQHH